MEFKFKMFNFYSDLATNKTLLLQLQLVLLIVFYKNLVLTNSQ